MPWLAVVGLGRSCAPAGRRTCPQPAPKQSSHEELQPDEQPAQPRRPGRARVPRQPGFMALEMVAGRLVQRHLGSSIYGWTSVIGVLLAGLSLGNFLGGKIADFVKSEKQASWLFLAASIFTLCILVLETQPKWFADQFLGGPSKSLLSQAISLSKLEAGTGFDLAELAVSDPVRRHARLLPSRARRWGRSAPWSPSWRSTG